MTNNFPTMDKDIFKDLTEILGDEIYDLLNEFLQDTPPQFALLSEAINASAFKDIFTLAHSQTSASGNLGLTKFQYLSQSICIKAKDENIQACTELYNALLENFKECEILLTQIIDQHSLL